MQTLVVNHWLVITQSRYWWCPVYSTPQYVCAHDQHSCPVYSTPQYVCVHNQHSCPVYSTPQYVCIHDQHSCPVYSTHQCLNHWCHPDDTNSYLTSNMWVGIFPLMYRPKGFDTRPSNAWRAPFGMQIWEQRYSCTCTLQIIHWKTKTHSARTWTLIRGTRNTWWNMCSAKCRVQLYMETRQWQLVTYHDNGKLFRGWKRPQISQFLDCQQTSFQCIFVGVIIFSTTHVQCNTCILQKYFSAKLLCPPNSQKYSGKLSRVKTFVNWEDTTVQYLA